jgi:hypothetical protein
MGIKNIKGDSREFEKASDYRVHGEVYRVP